MKVSYLVEILEPHLHLVKVRLTTEKPKNQSQVELFLPSWSPGSYLMREYARNVRTIRVTQSNGEILWCEQKAKGTWLIDWTASQLRVEQNIFSVDYEIYLHELTVRTSHVDASHAFLHGPSYLMAIVGGERGPVIEFRFPSLWSKLSTALQEIPGSREKFCYSAPDYDQLIDCPVEIGCHETDGFIVKGVPHALAFYGIHYPHHSDLKADMAKIVEEIIETMGEVPFVHYQFITFFVSKIPAGGLEHLNSTALIYDGRKLANRKDYLGFMGLVSHEYFHSWNVKRIRPFELGPFDYRHEAYTSMLWLAEGLTSFVDDLFVYRAGIASLEEYLDFVKSNLDAYYGTPGRKFHSLEDSSFNAWIKLYRPDENLRNSSVSYYLKGGLVFMALHALLLEQGKKIDHLLSILWLDYKQHPEKGISREKFYELLAEVAGTETTEKFRSMIETTQEIDFAGCLKSMGLELVWCDGPAAWLGAEWDFVGDRLIVKTVLQDSPAAKAGLNAGDEVLAINELRVLKEDAERLPQLLKPHLSYRWTVSRLSRLTQLEVCLEQGPRQIKEIRIVDRDKALKSFKR